MVATMIAGAYFAAGTFAYAATVFAVNFAVSFIVTRMFADNPETQQDMGVRQQVPPSAVNAIPIVYGNAYMGGTFVDAVLTVDQRKMYYVLAISSISPNGQFAFDQTDMYFGDRKIGFDPSEQGKVISLTDEAGNVDTKVSGNLFIYLFTSNQAGTITAINSSGTLPSGIMGGVDIAAGQRWPASGRQMNGLAFAIAVLNYNRDADTTQLSPITFKVSHTLNGTGVAKAGDVWYDYMTNAVYGGAVDAAFVNSTSATALNAYGDQNITFTNSSGAPSTQPRYRINGVLDAGQSVLSNVDRIVSACDSWMTYNAALGQWSVVINKAESTAYAFDDDNIIGEIRVSATDITSSINQVEARFPFKENRDQAAFVNIETPSGLLYPNEPVNKYSITYDMVNDSVQANYLANRLLEQAREDLIVSFSTTYYGIQVDAGDVVSVTNADYGWNAKLFRVMKVNEASLLDGNLGARLELSEYNAQVYDDFDITQFTPIPNSGLASVSYFSPLAAPTVTGFPSATFPNFDVQVFVPTTGRVLFGNLFYTVSASPSASDWKLLANAATSNSQPVTNNTYYTFANLSLGAGTYYFAYLVGNETSQSILSPISASFVWSPVGGTTGPTGATGPTGTGTTGATGLAAITAYKQQSQALPAPTFTTPTSGSAAPSGWSLSAPSVSVGQVLWYIQGKYNSSSITIDGVAPNTTAWTGPVAASIFQDIRSDNWNGSNPPTYGSSGTYGTVGYYIQQSTGDAYFNRGIFRGTVESAVSGSRIVLGESASEFLKVYDTAGNTVFRVAGVAGAYTNVQVVGASNTFGIGALSVSNASGFGGNALSVTNDGTGNGILSVANSTSSTRNSILGVGYGTGSNGAAIYASNSGNYGLYCAGQFGIDNSTVVTNLNANYLQGYTASNFMLTGSTATDSNALGGVTASSWTRIFATNSGTANAGGSGINLLGSTSTGVAGAYVGTSGTSNIVTFTVQTTSPSDVRLKEEIADSDLGLAFVKQLRPVSYKLKADPKHQKGYGFIADEVEELIELGSSLVYHEPDWKVGDETGFKTIHYPSYIAVLTKAIQELSAKVEALEAQLKG
jgi:hypothetical protein